MEILIVLMANIKANPDRLKIKTYYLEEKGSLGENLSGLQIDFLYWLP